MLIFDDQLKLILQDLKVVFRYIFVSLIRVYTLKSYLLGSLIAGCMILFIFSMAFGGIDVIILNQ